MKKRAMTLVMVAGIFGLANAQVGINTNTPAVTLDVVIDSKTSANSAIAEGVLVPRISLSILKNKDSAYGNNQNGALVYVNDFTGTTTTKTANVTREGFYYYDAKAGVWKTLGDDAGSGSSFTLSYAAVPAAGSINWSTYTANNFFEIMTTGASTINVPEASLFTDKTITISNKSGGNLTFKPADFGVSGLVLNGSLQAYSDGTRWYLLSGRQ